MNLMTRDAIAEAIRQCLAEKITTLMETHDNRDTSLQDFKPESIMVLFYPEDRKIVVELSHPRPSSRIFQCLRPAIEQTAMQVFGSYSHKTDFLTSSTRITPTKGDDNRSEIRIRWVRLGFEGCFQGTEIREGEIQ